MKIDSLKEVKYYPSKFFLGFQAYPFKWSQYEISYVIYYKSGKSMEVRYVAMWYSHHILEPNIGHLEIRRYEIHNIPKLKREIRIEVKKGELIDKRK